VKLMEDKFKIENYNFKRKLKWGSLDLFPAGM
jgi:hypothetical protein